MWHAITTVEVVEGKVNRHSHRWYSFKLYIYLVIQLPLSAAVEEDKVAKFRLSLAYRESQDPLVKAAITAVSQAEYSFKTREIIGKPSDQKAKAWNLPFSAVFKIQP